MSTATQTRLSQILVGDVVEGVATYPRSSTREVIVGRVVDRRPSEHALILDGGVVIPDQPGERLGARWALRVVTPALPTRPRSAIRTYDVNTLEDRVAVLASNGSWYWAQPSPEKVPLHALPSADVLHDVEKRG